MGAPPLIEHTVKGALMGAMLGGGVAALGWVMRARDATPIELGVPAPHLLARHRALAEALLPFERASHHGASTRALYTQLVRDCEFVVAQQHAKGGAQVTVQKRVSQALLCAKRIAHEAFRARDPSAHDCRAQVDEVEAHLGTVQRNMMMGE